MGKIKTKIKRYNFLVEEQTEQLIRKIVTETDLSITTIIIRGIEKFAKEKGISL